MGVGGKLKRKGISVSTSLSVSLSVSTLMADSCCCTAEINRL